MDVNQLKARSLDPHLRGDDGTCSAFACATREKSTLTPPYSQRVPSNNKLLRVSRDGNGTPSRAAAAR
jgi:hypothetical protein